MWLYDRFGWDVTVVAAAATLVLFTLPALTREPVPRVQTQKPSLKAFVKRPEALTIVITVLIVSFSMGITTAIDGAFLVDKGLSVAEVGIVLGIGQLAGYFLGVIASPLLSKVLKPSTSLGFGVAVLPMALLPPLVVSFLPAVDVVTASIAFGIGALGYGHLIVLYNAARFEWADTGQGGTDYAIQGSLVRVAGSAVTAVAGLTAATIGWTGFYLVALIFALICGLFFTWSSRRIRSLRAHRPEPASPARTPLIGEIETGRHVADAAIQ
jgi:cyanate permease